MKPCDPEVFRDGKPLLAADASECRAVGFERWVKAIARKSKQRVDWHYSGGVAQVLFLGDRALIEAAIAVTPCPARIMRWFTASEPGLYRSGVTEAPAGAIAAFYDGGGGSAFIVEEPADPLHATTGAFLEGADLR